MTQFHAYLVISRDDATMVLSTGEELREITDRVNFFVKGPTVFVGNVCGIRRIVQVSIIFLFYTLFHNFYI